MLLVRCVFSSVGSLRVGVPGAPSLFCGRSPSSPVPGCCCSGRSVRSSLPFAGSSPRRVVSRSRSSCCGSLWSRASSSSWSTSTTGACRPAARPPASARPGSGGAARAPPKPVAPLSVERRVVAGSPGEPGRSKPLSYQLQAPDKCYLLSGLYSLAGGRRWQAPAGGSYIVLRLTVLHFTERNRHRRLPDHTGLPLLRCHLLAPSTTPN